MVISEQQAKSSDTMFTDNKQTIVKANNKLLTCENEDYMRFSLSIDDSQGILGA